MNQLDPIEELYNMYSEEEGTPRIVEVGDGDLDFVLDTECKGNPPQRPCSQFQNPFQRLLKPINYLGPRIMTLSWKNVVAEATRTF